MCSFSVTSRSASLLTLLTFIALRFKIHNNEYGSGMFYVSFLNTFKVKRVNMNKPMHAWIINFSHNFIIFYVKCCCENMAANYWSCFEAEVHRLSSLWTTRNQQRSMDMLVSTSISCTIRHIVYFDDGAMLMFCFTISAYFVSPFSLAYCHPWIFTRKVTIRKLHTFNITVLYINQAVTY